MNEMGNNIGPIGSLPLHMGGENGGDVAIVLHDKEELSPPSNVISKGVYEGGLELIKMAVDGGVYDADDGVVGELEGGFKFFFNHVEISDYELGEFSKEGGGMEGWICVSLDTPEDVRGVFLCNDYGRGEAYSYVRNVVRGEVEGKGEE